MQALVILLAVIIILGGGWYWYSTQSADLPNLPPVTTNTPPPNIPPTPSTSTTTAATKEIVVTNAGMTFTTKTLTAKKGDQVKITFRNTGGTHDFRIDGYNVGTKVIQANQEESFTFTADETGDFEYFCSVGNHRAMGMIGTLTVTP